MEQNNQKVTIGVTGASGFVGKHLVKRLLDQSNYYVRCLTRSPDKYQVSHKNLSMIKGSLFDLESVKIFTLPCDIVIHLAFPQSNDLGSHLTAIDHLKKALKDSKTSRFIHCSTAVVAGATDESKITEATTEKPITDYEKFKLTIEKAILAFDIEGLTVSVVRPTAVFGAHGQNIVKTIKDVRSSSPFLNYVRKFILSSRCMNLVSIETVVDSIVFLATTEKAINKEVFIVSEDDSPNNNFLFVTALIEKEFGIAMPRWPQIKLPRFCLALLLSLKNRSNGNPGLIYSCEKLKRLGFRQRMPFERALESYISWYKEAHK